LTLAKILRGFESDLSRLHSMLIQLKRVSESEHLNKEIAEALRHLGELNDTLENIRKTNW